MSDDNKRKNHVFARIKWPVIVVSFCLAPIIGFILLAAKLVDAYMESSEQEARKKRAEHLENFTDVKVDKDNNLKMPVDEKKLKEQHKSFFVKQKAASILLIMLGVILISIGAGLALDNLSIIPYGYPVMSFIGDLLENGIIVALGVLSGWFGINIRKNIEYEKTIATIIGNRDNIPLMELQSKTGLKRKRLMDAVKYGISYGLFGKEAYVDMGEDMLIVRGPSPSFNKPAKENNKKQENVANNETEYQKIIRELREVNDAIPGEEMSNKIYELEDISAKIFEIVEKDPDKKTLLNRFMDYYLPTCQKLLNTYATLDDQGDVGENITETKKSIEGTMDNMIVAFKKQLDKMFESDAMDISSDIAAFNAVLNMDGVVEDEFSMKL